MHGWELRERRRAAGLTARQVARAAGTAESNIAAYERERKTPNRLTLARISAVVNAGAHSPIVRHNLLTIPALAAAIRAELRAGRATSSMLRLVRECSSNFAEATSPADMTAFLSAPSTTGDRRWDALVAGVAEDLALQRSVAVPTWTAGPAVDGFWYVNDNYRFDAYALAHAAPSLRVRGVVIDRGSLESV